MIAPSAAARVLDVRIVGGETGTGALVIEYPRGCHFGIPDVQLSPSAPAPGSGCSARQAASRVVAIMSFATCLMCCPLSPTR